MVYFPLIRELEYKERTIIASYVCRLLSLAARQSNLSWSKKNRQHKRANRQKFYPLFVKKIKKNVANSCWNKYNPWSRPRRVRSEKLFGGRSCLLLRWISYSQRRNKIGKRLRVRGYSRLHYSAQLINDVSKPDFADFPGNIGTTWKAQVLFIVKKFGEYARTREKCNIFSSCMHDARIFEAVRTIEEGDLQYQVFGSERNCILCFIPTKVSQNFCAR